MSSDNLIKAIDAALDMLGLNRICRAVEDDKAYYFTGCGDNGERIRGCACCCVEKGTLKCRPCYYDDPCWNTPKTIVEIPEERKSVFIEPEDVM